MEKSNEFRAPRPVERRPPAASGSLPAEGALDARDPRRRNSIDAPAGTPDWRSQASAIASADARHGARRVSTPAAHLHSPRAPSAASMTATAAAMDDRAGVPRAAAPPVGSGTRTRSSSTTSVQPRLTRPRTVVPDAAATSAEDEGEQMCVRALEEAQARIVAERDEIGRIQALLRDINEMRSSDGPDAQAFDDEDVREVESEITARQSALAIMEADLDARIHKYETEVSVVANAIRKRASVLSTAEHQSRVLSENPRLMDFFAHKQKDLIQIRKGLYEALAEDPPSLSTSTP